MNLLSNALKFTSSGYVSLCATLREDFIIITVEDTGCGIPASFLPRLFEPYKQAQSRVGTQRGTGLGLSIIKKLLSKMGGKVTVTSEYAESNEPVPENIGSVFTLSIPATVSSPTPQLPLILEIPTVAMLVTRDDTRSIKGHQDAWRQFGWEIILFESPEELNGPHFDYVWADALQLGSNLPLLKELLARQEYTVIVPYRSEAALRELPGIKTASHFVPMHKPLLWHSFEDNIALSKQVSTRSSSQLVRFAPAVDYVSSSSYNNKGLRLRKGSDKMTVLMVDDNPVLMPPHVCGQVLIFAD